jgi:hypothetical protein
LRKFAVLLMATALASGAAGARPIDRKAMVTRHNPVLAEVDKHAPLMIGNGDIAFTADITGLQTFPEQYSALAPLLTMAQWAWHSFPNPNGWTEKDGLVQVPVPGRGTQPYPWIRAWSELEQNPALVWLRENPHRFALGRVSLALKGRDGTAARFDQLTGTFQKLDMWTGTLTSRFIFDGEQVRVETRMHPDRDMLLVDIRSTLVADGRLGVDVRYPGVAAKFNPDPSDFVRDQLHSSDVITSAPGHTMVKRTIDNTLYWSSIATPNGNVAKSGQHQFHISAKSSDHLQVAVSFERKQPADPASVKDGVSSVGRYWRDYWTKGGMVDLTGSTDPRAGELQRRIILSQYLTAINQAGEIPPQEEGLFSNSWNGKFHLEVQPIHLGHWAQWGRPQYLEKNLGWYLGNLPRAKEVAKRHSADGAWWTKMTGPEGLNSPSTINPFIMWQQPAPIHMAELLWRTKRDRATLDRYAGLVEESAKLLASWPQRDAKTGRFHLGPPIIPVQENHPPLTTADPAFELEYFRYGLQVAQVWRERRGLKRVAKWDELIADFAAPPAKDGLLLPAATTPDFWTQAMSAKCSGDASDEQCLNRDHPSFLMSFGYLGSDRIDPETMRSTLRATEAHWDIRQTWGWDFPVIAMTAARIGEPDKAIDWLFMDQRNNQWGVSGMTPRVHLEAHAADLFAKGSVAAGPDGAGYRRAAETYFPSNGSLLLAVGMMAAGWDGSTGHAPGFPKKGWKVHTERIQPLP